MLSPSPWVRASCWRMKRAHACKDLIKLIVRMPRCSYLAQKVFWGAAAATGRRIECLLCAGTLLGVGQRECLVRSRHLIGVCEWEHEGSG